MAIEKILNKRSNDVVTDGGVENPKKPTSSQLDNGEIAVNYHKGTERIFIKNDNEEVVEFVSKDSLATVATSGSYNDLSDTPSIPTDIVEEITINNNTITPTDGKIDLGTVITSVKKGTTTLTPSSGVVRILEDTTPTNGSTNFITSGGVYTALQYYLTTSSANSTYEKKMSFTSVSSTLPSPCAVNTYYRIINPKTSLSIPLPSASLKAGDTIGVSFNADSSITTPSVSGSNIYKQDGWSTFFEANATYEIVALYDGGKWLVTSTKFNS